MDSVTKLETTAAQCVKSVWERKKDLEKQLIARDSFSERTPEIIAPLVELEAHSDGAVTAISDLLKISLNVDKMCFDLVREWMNDVESAYKGVPVFTAETKSEPVEPEPIEPQSKTDLQLLQTLLSTVKELSERKGDIGGMPREIWDKFFIGLDKLFKSIPETGWPHEIFPIDTVKAASKLCNKKPLAKSVPKSGSDECACVEPSALTFATLDEAWSWVLSKASTFPGSKYRGDKADILDTMRAFGKDDFLYIAKRRYEHVTIRDRYGVPGQICRDLMQYAVRWLTEHGIAIPVKTFNDVWEDYIFYELTRVRNTDSIELDYIKAMRSFSADDFRYLADSNNAISDVKAKYNMPTRVARRVRVLAYDWIKENDASEFSAESSRIALEKQWKLIVETETKPNKDDSAHVARLRLKVPAKLESFADTDFIGMADPVSTVNFIRTHYKIPMSLAVKLKDYSQKWVREKMPHSATRLLTPPNTDDGNRYTMEDFHFIVDTNTSDEQLISRFNLKGVQAAYSLRNYAKRRLKVLTPKN